MVDGPLVGEHTDLRNELHDARFQTRQPFRDILAV